MPSAYTPERLEDGDVALRVLHAAPSVGDAFGGISSAVASLGRLESALGRRPTLVTLDRPEQGTVLRDELDEWFDLVLVRPGPFAGRYHGGREMVRTLGTEVPRHDFLVLHSVFDFVSQVAHRRARASGVPYVLWPHGSLDPYDLRKHRLAKRGLAPLWRSALGGARALMCTSERESECLQTFGAQVPKAIVPLPYVGDRHVGDAAAVRAGLGLPEGARVVLFLGRLDEKKGLPLLLEAFNLAAAPDDLLLVAGSGVANFEFSIRSHAAGLARNRQIRFLGWVSGQTKTDVLAAADLFVLLSDNENFGLAVVEALAAGTPALISDQVYLAGELVGAGAAAISERSAIAAAKSLGELLDDPMRLARMSAAGQAYVREQLSIEAVARTYGAVLAGVTR